MQNRFVGDIGDFANHGILRALCGTPEKPVDGLKPGVVEYFNTPAPRDLEKGAGKHIEYLKVLAYNNFTYRDCDPELYNALRKLVGESLVNGAELTIDPERAAALLPVDERYYGDPIVAGERDQWIEGALENTANADVIFLNPDNGIELRIEALTIDSKTKNQIVGLNQETESKEHASVRELQGYARRGQSLMIYQHNVRIDGWINTIAKMLKDPLTFQHKQPPRIWALQWHTVISRAYFIVAQTPEDQKKISSRLEDIKTSLWITRKHFTVREFKQCPPSS